MRTNLIMHLHCAECGSVLKLAYENEVTVKAKDYSLFGSGNDPEPTGAAVRYIPPLFVVPCQACIEKHTGPARRLAAAITQLTETTT